MSTKRSKKTNRQNKSKEKKQTARTPPSEQKANKTTLNILNHDHFYFCPPVSFNIVDTCQKNKEKTESKVLPAQFKMKIFSISQSFNSPPPIMIKMTKKSGAHKTIAKQLFAAALLISNQLFLFNIANTCFNKNPNTYCLIFITEILF